LRLNHLLGGRKLSNLMAIAVGSFADPDFPPPKHSVNERGLTLDPRSVEAQSYLATALTARVLDNITDTAAADIVRAEGLAGQALAASPRSPLAHFAKGQVLRARRRPEEAISEYETVIALNRNWVNALAAISWCDLYTGSIDQA
jgi:tetratricopeptide (TPR) repeat protein